MICGKLFCGVSSASICWSFIFNSDQLRHFSLKKRKSEAIQNEYMNAFGVLYWSPEIWVTDARTPLTARVWLACQNGSLAIGRSAQAIQQRILGTSGSFRAVRDGSGSWVVNSWINKVFSILSTEIAWGTSCFSPFIKQGLLSSMCLLNKKD